MCVFIYIYEKEASASLSWGYFQKDLFFTHFHASNWKFSIFYLRNYGLTFLLGQLSNRLVYHKYYYRGVWVAPTIKHLALGVGWGAGLVLRSTLETSSESRVGLGFSLSFSLCPSPHTPALSLSRQWMNKSLKEIIIYFIILSINSVLVNKITAFT